MRDLFEINNTYSFNKDKLTKGYEYDYVTRTSINQGILQQTGFVNENNINPSGVWSLGLLQMNFFYRKKPWYAGQFVRKVTPKIALSEKSILYFSAVLNKQKKKLLSILVRDVDEIFKSIKIQLPVTKNGDINFDFMEKFIAELEAYLSATGLTDYALTAEEQKVLHDFERGDFKWSGFKVKNLFGESTRGKRLKSDDRIEGDLPFVTAGEVNTGISAHIANDVKVFSANTTTIDMFGSAKYRNYTYGGDDHIAVVHTQNLPKYVAMFVTAAIHKASHTGEFHYGRNFYAKDADNLVMQLPVEKHEPDYLRMQTLISAVHKLVIKQLVLYAREKIGATAMLVKQD